MYLDVVLSKMDLTEQELSFLLEERKWGNINFTLIDCREPFYNELSEIAGTDENIPGTEVDKILENHGKEDMIILYSNDPNSLKYVSIHIVHAGIQNTFFLNEDYEKLTYNLEKEYK